MADLVLKNVDKAYGEVKVLKDIDLDIKTGELIVFVGPSGCGKSTLLRMIAGLEKITGGEFSIDGVRMNDVPPAQRGIAMVFQSYALYPHMTVRDNMSFALKIAKKSAAEIDAAVDKAAKILQLTPYLDRLPKALSGGQRQRVAIGRSIVRDPKVYLFDEPLSNLDAALRVATRLEIAQLKEAMPNSTMIYVTHDQVEAMTLSDLVVVLDKGVVAQVGRPLELFHRPANLFVAGFIGSPQMNLLSASVAGQSADSVTLTVNGTSLTIPNAGHTPLGSAAVTLGIRPDRLELAETGQLSGTIRLAERLGTENHLHIDLDTGGEVVAITGGTHRARARDRVQLRIPPEDAHVFDAEGRALPRRLDPATEALITDTNRPADPA